MRKNQFVLKGVSDFAPGAFENTAVEAGSIQLGSRGNEYLTSGSYTSPVVRPRPFTKLVTGWNADTPNGTTVELLVRVLVNGKWSRWLGFGSWSPFISRASREQEGDDIAYITGDTLHLTDATTSADALQMRATLTTEQPAISPRIYLLAATVNSPAPSDAPPVFCDRVLEVPTYSCLVRDPAIGAHIPSATTLTMLMNRWGRDVLPEEIARCMYDSTTGRFGNAAFASAIAGVYGYECYPGFCELNALRREVQHGYAVAAQVHYRAPALGQQNDTPAATCDEGLPLWEEAVVDSTEHLLVVRGFYQKNGQEMVVVNEPYSDSNQAVRHEIPSALFARLYTGLALFFHKGPPQAGAAAPERRLTTLDFCNGEVLLSAKGEVLQPGENIPGKANKATIGFTVYDGTAYASAAQKKFYYLTINPDSTIRFDEQAWAGYKITFYLIGVLGTTWVAEKQLEKKPEDT